MSYVPNWPPKETIDPATYSRYGLVAKIPTDELLGILEKPLPENARPGISHHVGLRQRHQAGNTLDDQEDHQHLAS